MKRFRFLFYILVSLLYLSGCDFVALDDATLNGPTLAIVAPNGEIFVGDGYYNSRIAVFSPEGKFLRSWGERGFASGQIQNPHGITFTPYNDIVIADRDNGRIQLFSLAGKYLKQIHSEQLGRPWAVACDSAGFIYAVDGGDQDEQNPRSGITKLNQQGKIVAQFSKFGSNIGELNWGHAIAVDPAGMQIYVADLKNNRVQKFVPYNLENTVYGVDTSFSQSTGSISEPPLGICYSAGKLYVGYDKSDEPIWVFDAKSGNLINKIAAGKFERPHGISVDNSGYIWVTDVEQNKVFKITTTGDILLTLGAQ